MNYIKVFITIFFITLISMHASVSKAQMFEKIDIGIPGLSHGKVNWLDINNDNVLDIFVSGVTDSLSPGTFVYINNGSGNFEKILTGIPHISNASVSWSDYDRDNDLDILLTGYSLNHNGVITRIYRNDLPAGFTELNFSFADIHSGSARWVDFNNDGMDDFSVSGLNASGIPVFRIYKNTSGLFSDAGIILTALYNSTMEFYDFDKDGDPDLLMSGQINEFNSSYQTKIYLNENNTYIESGIVLPSMSKGSASWGDFNADGFADILINGEVGTNNSSALENRVMIFHNNGDGTFSEHNASLPGIAFGNALWADFDNNGFLDILMTGNLKGNHQGITKIFINNNGIFTEVPNSLPEFTYGNVSTGDFDNDLKLDILIEGHNNQNNKNVTSIYRNLIPLTNDLPVEPKGLTTTFDNNVIHFGWLPGSDPNTPAPGLTYNIKLGTTPGGVDIVSPVSNGNNGYSRFPGHGNAGNNTNIHFTNLDSGTYYWSVQTVDNSLNTSDYSAEVSFKYTKNNVNISSVSEIIPELFNLKQNYPNPFNPVTNILFDIAKDVNVKLNIYNSKGQLVEVALNEFKKAGSYSVSFDGNNLSSGIYFYNLETNDYSETRKMLLIK